MPHPICFDLSPRPPAPKLPASLRETTYEEFAGKQTKLFAAFNRGGAAIANIFDNPPRLPQ